MKRFLVTALAAACAGALTVSAQPGPLRKVEINVERKKGTRVERMDPAAVFDTGDLVRFRFRLSFSGYLYVINQSSSGKFTQLFPKSETGLDNRVEKDREYVLPADDTGWFRIEEPAGYEMVYWMVSPRRLSDRESGPLTTPAVPRPDRMTPRCDDTIFRARGECLDSTAGPRAVTGQESLPPSMAVWSDIQPRDLDLVKVNKTTSVMGRDDSDAPFVYVFRLAHRAGKK